MTVSSSMSVLLCVLVEGFSYRCADGDGDEQWSQQAAVRLHRSDEFVFLVDGSQPLLYPGGLDEIECSLFPFLIAFEPLMYATFDPSPARFDDLLNALSNGIDRGGDQRLIDARVDGARVVGRGLQPEVGDEGSGICEFSGQTEVGAAAWEGD